MALLHRIKHTKLSLLSRHFNRFYLRTATSSSPNHKGSWRVADFCCNHLINSKRSLPVSVFSNNVRFFAAPIQFQKKVEVKEPRGHRLNEQIKAEFVRLVTDEGHGVVSRREALERARTLNLDLVEVDHDAKPPVCKIIDYHKERYVRQLKDKERAKIKSQGSLKKGDCKEVRFSAKTELKDLKMKADTAKRLMERGYRVKCVAMGTEDQDLSGLLSQLSEMLEDVAIVETGPRVERKQSYIIVRHIKFGPSKKGGKKASNVDGATSSKTQASADPEEETEEVTYSEESDVDNDDEVDDPLQGEGRTKWSVSDSKRDLDRMLDLNCNVKGTSRHANMQMKFDAGAPSTAGSNNKAAGFSQSRLPNFRTPNVGESSQEAENRYARNMKTNDSSSRQFVPRSNAATNAGNRSSSSKDFGIFSAPTVNGSEKHRSGVEANRYGSGKSSDFRRNPSPGGRSDGTHGSLVGGSGKYGMFSGESSNPTPGRSSNSN